MIKISKYTVIIKILIHLSLIYKINEILPILFPLKLILEAQTIREFFYQLGSIYFSNWELFGTHLSVYAY